MKRLKPTPANRATFDPALDTLNVPREIRQMRQFTHEVRFAFAALWQKVGRSPGKLTVDYIRLGIELGASERACRRWIATLARAGLIEVLAREPGQVHVRVRDWRGAEPPAERTDPQMQLGIVEPEAQDASADAIPIWRHRQAARRPNVTPPAAG